MILCILCYIISFAQAFLPIDVKIKGVLWFIFFGMAKLFQYTALLILGEEGIKYIKKKLRIAKQAKEEKLAKEVQQETEEGVKELSDTHINSDKNK